MTITNSILKYVIYVGLALIAFIPLYVANSNFFPFITGKAFAFRIIVEIVFALWLVLILRERGTATADTDQSVAPRVNMMTILVTAFALVTLIANLAGMVPLRSIWSNFERMEGWMTIIHLWGYFMVVSSVFRDKKFWAVFLNVTLVAGLFTAFYGLFQFFGWTETHQGGRIDASLGNAAYMAVYMLINAFLAGYMAVSARSTGLKWSYGIAAAFFSFIMFQTATRGTALGWIGAILVACFIYAVWGRKENSQSNTMRAVTGGVIGLIIILGVLFYFNRDAQWIVNNNVLGRLATISLSDTKTQARGYTWPMAVEGAFSSPKTALIGWGQENFNYIFNANYDPEMWKHEQWFDRAHSVFLDWLVAAGVFGLGLYLSLYVIALLYIIKSSLTLGQKVMLIGLIVGYGIHNVFVFDNQTSYVMFFMVLALVQGFRPGKIHPWFAKTSGTQDMATMRDYVAVPIVVLAFLGTLYTVNIRPLQANHRLIDALIACANPTTMTPAPFERALALGETVANQEIREQMYTCGSNVIRSGATDQAKVDFYNFVMKETQNHIAATPQDARAYIIAGGFFDSITDFKTAQPLLEKAAALSPGKQSIMFELAYNYLNTDRQDDALKLMQQAYESDMTNPTSKAGYAVTLVSTGNEKKFQELFGNDPSILNDPRIPTAYVAVKNYPKAIEAYKEQIKNNPEDPELYSNLASAYYLNKQVAASVDVLKTAAVKFPLLKTQIEDIIKQVQTGKLPQ